MRLLARREHAARELTDKLERRGFDTDAIEAVIERLAAEGWQSDQRFTEQFVRERVDKGEGPLKIRSALSERGVDSATADSVLAEFDGEWLERAQAVCNRRFGQEPPVSWHERARRARYLQQRGFSAEIVGKVTAFDEGASGE